MAIVKCQNGHYYDDRKSTECPLCTGNPAEPEKRLDTIWLEAEESETDDKTVGIYRDKEGNDFLTGWIVCVEGPDKGRDYRLHQGYNRIGRAPEMDICPVNDLQISRSNHCSIVYEQRKNLFYFISESGSISYYNGKLAENICQMHTGDQFRIGESEFEFVAFCREGRSWGL